MNTMTIEEFKKEVNDGKIFSVEFVKKNGDVRVMVARRGVSKGVINDPGANGSHNRKAQDEQHKVLTVYDINKMEDNKEHKGAFRRINLESIISVKLHGVNYKMKDNMLVSE